MKERDEPVKDLLKLAAGGPVDRELRRDLWPDMLQRLEEHTVRVPWWDWVLGGALLASLLLFPETIPLVLYQL